MGKGESSGSSMSSLGSFNQDSSVSGSSLEGHFFGESLGSNASGSSGSYMQIWQWLILATCLCCCLGGIAAALGTGKKTKKKSKRPSRQQPPPVVEAVALQPVDEEIAVV